MYLTEKKRKMKNLLAIILVLVIGCVSACDTSRKTRPNIIILLVDDAGYADFGFMGCEDLETPNIDMLASNGVVFSDAHVTASVCGPSRAGLMIGKYQQRIGFECNPDRDFPGLPGSETTIAEVMKTAGYRTAAFGKWHLGSTAETKPNVQGFDYYWGFLSGSRSYFPYENLERASKEHRVRENDSLVSFEGYLTDVLAEKCTSFIHESKDDPFFIYWSPNAVHTPMEAKKKDMQKYAVHPRQKLAAMTWSLDQAVGQIVQQLKDDDIFENTLIFFLSDNGGAHNNQSSCLPLKGFKGNEFEGGHRVPFFIHWPQAIAEGSVFSGLTSSLDIYATSVAVAGAEVDDGQILDGVDLMPFLLNNPEGHEPHAELYWRKDAHAAARLGDMKLLRIRDYGSAMYRVSEDIGETENLFDTLNQEGDMMTEALKTWESDMKDPLWIEPEDWNKVTMEIHSALIENREPHYKDPGAMKHWSQENDED